MPFFIFFMPEDLHRNFWLLILLPMFSRLHHTHLHLHHAHHGHQEAHVHFHPQHN